MISPTDLPADELRSLDQLALTDTRMQHFTLREGNTFRPFTQADRHAAISPLALNPEVPEDIRVQFDTARNIYLYAWHVYRFHVVAEQHALTTLELALRTSLTHRGLIGGASSSTSSVKGSTKKERDPNGLRQLLDRAAKERIIVNTKLPFRERWALSMASQRISFEYADYMRRHGIDQMEVAEEPAVPNEEELNFDWIERYCEVLPKIRNNYAHGSSTLHASVLRTFEVVWSLVNQMFEQEDAHCAHSGSA